jgi:radical SAM protein with 4Fe4S-binding SPASM domain
MIRITRFLQGGKTISEVRRHRAGAAQGAPSGLVAFLGSRRPVVFWTITKQCNLSCRHCYIDAGGRKGEELSLEEAEEFIRDLAGMRIPLLMFTGGEPLVKNTFWDLAGLARGYGLTTAISSNGTLITREIAERLKAAGIEYVGVSLDGSRAETHDAIRNEAGSFAGALRGLRHCADAGIKTGIRMTVTRENRDEVGELIELSRKMKVPRFCVYWLVPSGRGRDMYGQQIEPAEAGEILDLLVRKAREFGNGEMEILTVDAPQDGIHLLDSMKEAGDPEYGNALELLRYTGDSCSAGDRVASVDPAGNVYPCQFMQREEFRIGNIRERRFSEIWADAGNPILSAFRNKTSLVKGKCATCGSRDLCGGGCRVRAYEHSGDLWAEDPLCRFPKGPIGENG